MLISTYDAFVQRTDQSAGLAHEERLDIAAYGVAAEVGSVISAIKKRLLAREGSSTWNTADQEIVEELGDVIWYCFSLAGLSNRGKPVNIFSHDISNLKQEISGVNPRGERIRNVLDASKRDEFLAAAERFPRATRDMTFDDYQEIAFLTARTTDRTLAEVCLVVLQQLSAQLLRSKLPPIELELNNAMADRPTNDILGEMAWHVAALASLFQLKLSGVTSANVEKVSDRWDKTIRTPLHDASSDPLEQIPRRFEVVFVTFAPGRSKMFVDGAQLGDELTDHAYDDDGYRFHDVMHLANAAKLGWSPVLRSLMKRKRKKEPRVDEVEDGARAQIVEEAVIKAIHSEGVRLARLRGELDGPAPAQLFPTGSDITFGLLKSVRNLVANLEVEKNRFSEWEAAILDGYDIFNRLRRHRRGTVTVDLEQRSLTFSPNIDTSAIGLVTP
jgi:NTP pyrophosphatase (non-canonical NTP hydrolase)